MKNLIFSIILISSCGIDDSLHDVCPEACFGGSKYARNVGSCKVGTTVCDKNGNTVKDENGKPLCEGEILPTIEICDGLDNDCDGLTDEDLSLKRTDENYPCPSIGECRNSAAICISGEYSCIYPPTVELPNETRCDGLDNDCDGAIDEEVFDSLPFGMRSCYSGSPVESAANPPCHPGILECNNGDIICINEKTPSVELCDNIDNDCDGFIDNTGNTLSQKYDIVFIVDTSGSMCDAIAAVVGASTTYASQFDGNENFKFALIVISSYAVPMPRIKLELNFSDFSALRGSLSLLGCTGSPEEGSLDGALYVCRDDNILNLNWRSDADKMFFMFTDEPAQTYIAPPTTASSIITACLNSGVLPFIWSNYPADFENIALGGNGMHFTLINDWRAIFADMNSIILTLCR